MKIFLRCASVLQMVWALMLMYLAGMNPAGSAKVVGLAILFGISSLVTSGILD